MLSQLSSPEISGVVIATLDRFFRPDVLSTYSVFKDFETFDKKLYCELGELNLKDPRDQMMLFVWGQQAGFERQRIKERMNRGKAHSRDIAQQKSDTLPTGVIFDKDSKLFQYTPAAQRVRMAMKRLVDGETLTSIAADLGFTSPTALRVTLRSYW